MYLLFSILPEDFLFATAVVVENIVLVDDESSVILMFLSSVL